MSEWLKVMLEEIARKRAAAEEARLEADKRSAPAPGGARSAGQPVAPASGSRSDRAGG